MMDTRHWLDIVEAGIKMLRIVRDLLAEFDELAEDTDEPVTG